MADGSWSNPWKLTAIGMALVVVTATVTGLVVANWSGGQADRNATESRPAPTPSAPGAPVVRPQQPVPAPQRVASESRPRSAPAVPTQAAVTACHQHAAAQVGHRDKTVEIVKDGAIGAGVGAAVGAAGGAIAGGGKGAGQGAAIGAILGAGGGSLYGLNENQKHDARYREAYAGCMRARGYAG